MDAMWSFKRLGWLCGLSFLLLCFFPTKVQAEYYSFDQGSNNNFAEAQKIENPQYEQYIYGLLGSGEDVVDYYSLEFTEFTPQVRVRLLVPDATNEPIFKPSLVIVDTKQTSMIGNVPFGFPLNTGGRVFPWTNLAEKKHTDDSVLETFFVGPNFIRDMAPGRYTLAVFDPEGVGGRYTLQVGAVKPAPSVQSRFAAFLALLRIKFRLY